MISIIGVDNFCIDNLTREDLNVLSRIIDSAPLPDKRYLYKLKNEIKSYT